MHPPRDLEGYAPSWSKSKVSADVKVGGEGCRIGQTIDQCTSAVPTVMTEKKEGTKIDVSSDKRLITVVHDGESQSLYLPTHISGTAQVTFPLEKKTEISARLHIEDEHEWILNASNEIQAPWCADDLSDETVITCRGCQEVLLSSGKVKTWKNLPSENWAELMDLWFCHKPHDHSQHQDDDAARAKGFSAKSQLAVYQGTGMTDLASIVLNAQDCDNIKAAEKLTSSSAIALRCQNCTERLGSTTDEEEIFRLDKAKVATKLKAEASEFETYPLETFVCAQLLSLLESTPNRKIVVHSTEQESNSTDTNGLLLWVFNPDIYYSSSAHPLSTAIPPATPTSIVRRAAKIFYKLMPSPQEHLDLYSTSVEELQLPSQTDVETLHSALRRSNAILPQSAKEFQDWKVGLLDRYEKVATGEDVIAQNPLSRKTNAKDGRITRWTIGDGVEGLYA